MTFDYDRLIDAINPILKDKWGYSDWHSAWQHKTYPSILVMQYIQDIHYPDDMTFDDIDTYDYREENHYELPVAKLNEVAKSFGVALMPLARDSYGFYLDEDFAVHRYKEAINYFFVAVVPIASKDSDNE